LLEVFNPNSPSLWYGLLGLKLYFAYVPLFFLGYGLLKNESDLRRFLFLNLGLAALIALLGAAQGITGTVFLSPAELAPDIRELGGVIRTAPITGEKFLRPPSVFTSDGRFGGYLLFAWLLGMGATAYFFLQHLPGRKWLLLILGLIMTALVLSGVRGSLVSALISTAVIVSVYVRDIRWRTVRMRRMAMAAAAILLFASLSVVLLWIVYPQALAPRIAFYQQTLSPSGSGSELTNRVWNYPVSEFLKTFDFPSWFLGYGTGTCSLGAQYVTRILGVPRLAVGVESGYGNLTLEMGIPGLLLWLVWTGALLTAEWNVVRRLRGKPLFPLGFVIFWFSFITLVPGMASGLTTENYITNAYLFLLSGVLFSLPALSDTLLRSQPGVSTH